jgi:hypothetical protein
MTVCAAGLETPGKGVSNLRATARSGIHFRERIFFRVFSQLSAGPFNGARALGGPSVVEAPSQLLSFDVRAA